jgi:polysaccharide biosynthesis/export protein
MMRTAIIPAIFAVVALTACASQDQKNIKKNTPAPPAAAAQEKPSDGEITQDFVIGAEDVLSIAVYGEPQFTVTSESVRPDGIISMPLVGELKAMGKPPRDLEAEIAKTLAEKYLRYTPRVQVRVDKVLSRYYMIQGAVNKPGKFELLVPTTIMQALVNAGGFHEFANTKKISLLRDGKPFEIFNYNDAIKGKHSEKNIMLKHGDLIVVKE